MANGNNGFDKYLSTYALLSLLLAEFTASAEKRTTETFSGFSVFDFNSLASSMPPMPGSRQSIKQIS
jgi:hypothetical protein